MSTATETQTPIVSLTDKAREQVLELMKTEEDVQGKFLRVFVESGGCSGYSYGMEFDDREEDDFVADFDGVVVLVDPKSAKFLKGMTVDWVTSWQETGFKITNPNASATCGCGHSFSV